MYYDDIDILLEQLIDNDDDSQEVLEEILLTEMI